MVYPCKLAMVRYVNNNFKDEGVHKFVAIRRTRITVGCSSLFAAACLEESNYYRIIIQIHTLLVKSSSAALLHYFTYAIVS